MWIKFVVVLIVVVVLIYFVVYGIDVVGYGVWVGYVGGILIGGVLFVVLFFVLVKILCIVEVLDLLNFMLCKVMCWS